MIDRFRKAFFAYPSQPTDLTSTIDDATKALNRSGSRIEVKNWPNMGVFGANIPDEIRQDITEIDVLICDVTYPNLNVYYEAGYAIGQGKSLAPVINRSFSHAVQNLQKDGLFDNIGYKTYENISELVSVLHNLPDTSLLDLYSKPINYNQPIFFMDAIHKTDFINSVVSGIKGAKVFYRSFDPVEIPRFSSIAMISQLTSSAGIIVPFLAPHVGDADRHNLRAAFVTGIGHGLGRSTLILKAHKDEHAGPTDYRDLIEFVQSEGDIYDKVGTFSKNAIVESQGISTRIPKKARTKLQKLTLGSSAAENEFRTLENYFVETSEFVRTKRGEVNVVAGRKGSGKTAIFFMVRDDYRELKNTVVVDLKPESHQLSLFRQELSKIIDVGIFDHTLAAFWYFVALSEIALTIKRQLAIKSKYDGTAYAAMREIDDSLEVFKISETGDFTTRINRLGSYVMQEIETAKAKGRNLTADSLTNIVFRNGITQLKSIITKFTTAKTEIIFLFDNIDKGWPTTGVDKFDIVLVRLLIEALDKVRRDLDTVDRSFMSVVFLRNDIYELLVDQTPDRGKAAQIRIDWTDRVKLRQVLFNRLQASTRDSEASFEELWERFFCRGSKQSKHF